MNRSDCFQSVTLKKLCFSRSRSSVAPFSIGIVGPNQASHIKEREFLKVMTTAEVMG